VSQHKVSETLQANVENIRRLLVRIIPLVDKAGCRNGCPSFTKSSMLTHKENFPPKTYAKLKMILEG
jgi:ATP-dependent helicase YprA (DUF1998 family)